MTMLRGRDISQWQAVTPPLSGYDFCIARATFGIQTDTHWDLHSANILGASLVLGAYHFGYGAATAPIAAQAAYFIRVVGGKTRWLMLDMESSADPMTEAEAREFISVVHTHGLKCGLYHSESGFPDVGQDWNAVAYWVATPPPIRWDIWQWTDNDHGVDGDYFAGSIEQLRQLAEVPIAMPILPTDTPTELIDIVKPAGTNSAGPTGYAEDFATALVLNIPPANAYPSFGIQRPRPQDGLLMTPILFDGKVVWSGGDWFQNRRLKAATPTPASQSDVQAVQASVTALQGAVGATQTTVSAIAADVAAIRAKTDKDLS